MKRALAMVVTLVLLASACGNRNGGGDSEDLAADEDTDVESVENGGSTDVGITDDEIHIGVIADLTGVVPGLFKAAPQAVQAYAAMVNENGGIHGRQLVVDEYDTGTSDNGNRLAYEKACGEVFASVGSESAFDTGGYEAVAACGFPHLAGFTTDPEVDKLDFVLPRTSEAWTSTGYARWLAEQHPDAVKQAAYFYVIAGSAERGARRVMESRSTVGWEFPYEQGVAALESNYTPHVLEMKNRGIRAFSITSDDNNVIRLLKAMREQGYTVEVADLSGQAYQQEFLETAGPSAEGAYIALDHIPFEDADSVPAMAEYLEWLEKTSPGAVPSSNGLRAWTMAMLFAEAAEAVGPELTRDALIEHIRGIENWDADGLLAPRDLGQDIPSTACFMVLQVRDGEFVRAHPDEGFDCSPEYIYMLEDAGR